MKVKTTPLLCFLISVLNAQFEWNIKHLIDKNNYKYTPLSDVPYTGKVYSNYYNGEIKVSGAYVSGIKDGLWTEWYNNGKKMKQERYENGKRNGGWSWWYYNGKIKQQGS